MNRTRAALIGTLLAIAAMGTVVATGGAAEIPPTRECATTVKRLIAEIPTSVDASEAAYKKGYRDFFKKLAMSECISDAKPLIRDVALTPRNETCRAASADADKFWKPFTARFKALNEDWKRYGAPKEQRIRQLQTRIRQLREGGASQARINRVVRTRRAVGRKLNRFNLGLQRRARKIIGPAMYDSFLTLTELVSLRCLSPKEVFGRSESPGPAGTVVARNFDAVILPLIQMTEEPGGEIAVYRYFESLDLD